jgi:site-specific recombinase XerD
MEYHRTKDTFYVRQLLGHKRIENTLIYVQFAEELFKYQIAMIFRKRK